MQRNGLRMLPSNLNQKNVTGKFQSWTVNKKKQSKNQNVFRTAIRRMLSPFYVSIIKKKTVIRWSEETDVGWCLIIQIELNDNIF